MGRLMWTKLIMIAASATAVMLTSANAETPGRKSVNYTQSHAFTPVYGQTLPPIGYVNFCARNAGECRSTAIGGGAHSTIILTSKRWSELNEVNSYVNAQIEPVSDMEQHNVPEHWGYPAGEGDCEDYVLLKKRYLEGLGFAPEALLITVVLDEVGEGHAVLTVRTDGGDFILDNRRDKIHRWADTHYQFLKRQSQQDPRVWVALTRKRGRNPTLISGGN